MYLHTKSETSYTQTLIRSTSAGGFASFVPGVSYAVCKRLQVEVSIPDIISLSYTRQKTYNDAGVPPSIEKGSVFAVNANVNSNLLSYLGIGFKFILGK